MSDTGNASYWTVFVGACAVAVAFLGQIIAAVWTLGRSRISADEKIKEKDDALTAELISMERRFKGDIVEASRQFGETIAALRAKVNDIELWNRDNFVSKATFQTVIGDIRRSWERFEDQLRERLDRIDKKLDHNNGSH